MLVEQRAFAKIRVTGGDRLRFLQGMLTNDVAALASGGWQRAAILNVKGRVLAVVDVVHQGESFLLVTPEALENIGYLKKRYDVLKVLGDGEIKKKLTVSAHRFSASAKAKIEGAGGSVATLAAKTPAAEKSPRKQSPAKAKK